MKRVLFVDDDPSLVSGLKRMLRPLRKEWDMHFVISGEAALELIKNQPFDVIVSDMRMPGMNGVELLSIIQKQYPHIVRIILSGYSDQDLLLKSVRPTHMFLTKPCDAETLKRTVHRASRMQKMLESEDVKRVIAKIDSLPSLPNLYNEIITMLQNEDVSIKEVAGVIEKDVGMTAQILKLVNSSFFGFYKNITSPRQAATILGLDTIKTLVLSIEIFSKLQTSNPYFSFDVFWKHSMHTAVFAKEIARHIKDDTNFIEDAFMAGFLHDIGILILASQLSPQYEEVLKTAKQKKMDVWQVEQQLLGTDHGQIGGYLLGLWGFADNLVEGILLHHNPGMATEDAHSLPMIIYVADMFTHILTDGMDELNGEETYKAYLKQKNISDQAAEWFEACKAIYESGDQT